MAHTAGPARNATATQAKAQPDKFGDRAKYKCSSCATCCAGCALPSAMPRIPEPASTPTVFADEVVSVDAIVSDGPDRPPRSQLA